MDQQVGAAPVSDQNYQKKKKMALIALAFIGFFVILVMVVSLFSGSSQTPQSEEVKNSNSVVQVTPVAPLNQWETFSSAQFEIQYPPTWRAQNYSSENGVGVMIMPSTLPAGVLSPKVSVEVVPTSELSLDARISSLRNGGFKEEAYRSGDMVGYQFSHVLPFKPAKGQIINTPIQETFIVFEKNGSLFTIGYEHDEEGGAAVEQIEKQIVGTFKVK